MNPVIVVPNTRKRGSTISLRPLTIEEVKGLDRGTTLWFLDLHGQARHIRVNGRVKTWKTRPDVEVPVKYGLYECATFRWDGTAWMDGNQLYREATGDSR
jgi:hypothetical protein